MKRSDRLPLTRADLPSELTPETLRHVDFRTLRQLARPDNGVLDAEEQQQLLTALRQLRRGTASRVDESLQRSRRRAPRDLDPAMRRSYERTQQLLAAQAERVRERYPALTADAADPAVVPEPDAPTTTEQAHDDLVSPDTLEQEVEQTSETLDMLERIATLQQQQLEHQESKLLSETRGFFFAFLVSVAVIIAGVAPLVDADPHNRLLIVLWTVLATGVAGVAYAVVRAVQAKK